VIADGGCSRIEVFAHLAAANSASRFPYMHLDARCELLQLLDVAGRSAQIGELSAEGNQRNLCISLLRKKCGRIDSFLRGLLRGSVSHDCALQHIASTLGCGACIENHILRGRGPGDLRGGFGKLL